MILDRRAVMNEINQAISSYDYDGWGNPMNSTVSEESAYRYTGHEYDEETGLHNFRARLYDSTLMRFYQVDPAEQFASPYVYCCNSPIGLVDPDGKLVYQAIRPVYYFGVMTPFKHQFLINIPDNPSDFARFGQRTNIYGKIGFTVGATKSDDGHLAMKYNEQTDLLYARRYLQNVSSSLKEKVIKPIGHKGTDTEFIITIVHKANNYAMNTEDKPIEYPSTVQQFSKPNSNSWIQSLLRSIIGSKFQTDMDPKGDIGCDREIDPELFEEPTE